MPPLYNLINGLFFAHYLAKINSRIMITYTIEQLSTREKQTLSLLAGGLEYNQIALEMGISINGVRANIKNIYRKLQVNNNVQAARQFWRYKSASSKN